MRTVDRFNRIYIPLYLDLDRETFLLELIDKYIYIPLYLDLDVVAGASTGSITSFTFHYI